MMTVDQFLIGGMKNFTYLLCDGAEAMVIDPQYDLSAWERKMADRGAHLVGIVLTHSHWDHVAGVPAAAVNHPAAKIHLHALDAPRLKKYPIELRARFSFVDDGDSIACGSARLEVLHTPGHSAGECCYLVAGTPPLLFTGDTVFVNQVGRTDLDTGSTAALFETLQRLKRLPPETVVYPGHDYGETPCSTIGQECGKSAAFFCKTIEELDALP